MRRNSSLGDYIFEVFNYVVMALLLIVTLFPFWNQALISLSSREHLYSLGTLWYPKSFNFDSYIAIFHYDAIWRGYWNTIVRTVLGTALSILFTALTAYPLAKSKLPINKPITFFILFTMLFSGGLIPSYLLIKGLGLMNSIWALILPGLIGPVNVFIIRNYFRSLPVELEESAVIDGASHLKIFFRISLPLSAPILATVALWVGVAHWQAWYDVFLYITDTKKWVLQSVIRRILIENRPQDLLGAATQVFGETNAVDPRQMEAAVVMISILPMLFIYPFLQRYFVTGLVHGAVKG